MLSRWIARVGAALKAPTKFFVRPQTRPSDEAASGAVERTVAGGDVEPPVSEPAAASPVDLGDGAVADAGSVVTIDEPASSAVEADARTEVTIDEPAAGVVAEDKPAFPKERPRVVPLDTGPSVPPDQHEIQRRREIIRTLFNDFWSGTEEKPPRFVDRLDQAEPYLNERLRALDEPWRLDADSRRLLGLPPSAC
jgi:hypothetical protein